MSQTSYAEQVRALIGMKANLVQDKVVSYAAEGAIKFGRYVSLGTDKEKQVKLPATATDITAISAKRGVALQDHARENLQDGLDPQYADKATVSVMTEGMAYVEVEEAVVPTDDVFVRVNSGNEGMFRTDADTAAAAQLADARWVRASETIDGKLVALLELL